MRTESHKPPEKEKKALSTDHLRTPDLYIWEKLQSRRYDPERLARAVFHAKAPEVTLEPAVLATAVKKYKANLDTLDYRRIIGLVQVIEEVRDWAVENRHTSCANISLNDIVRSRGAGQSNCIPSFLEAHYRTLCARKKVE